MINMKLRKVIALIKTFKISLIYYFIIKSCRILTGTKVLKFNLRHNL